MNDIRNQPSPSIHKPKYVHYHFLKPRKNLLRMVDWYIFSVLIVNLILLLYINLHLNIWKSRLRNISSESIFSRRKITETLPQVSFLSIFDLSCNNRYRGNQNRRKTHFWKNFWKIYNWFTHPIQSANKFFILAQVLDK